MGGWVKEFSPRWASKLSQALPAELSQRVIGLAEWHASIAADRPETPQGVRDSLELFEAQLGRFREQLRGFRGAAADLLHAAAHKFGDPDLLSRCRDDLTRLDTATGAAWQYANDSVRTGRRSSLTEAFAREIARAFLEFDLKPDSRPTGDYCFALGLAFDAIEQEHGINLRPDDLRSLARRALDRIKMREKGR